MIFRSAREIAESRPRRSWPMANDARAESSVVRPRPGAVASSSGASPPAVAARRLHTGRARHRRSGERGAVTSTRPRSSPRARGSPAARSSRRATLGTATSRRCRWTRTHRTTCARRHRPQRAPGLRLRSLRRLRHPDHDRLVARSRSAACASPTIPRRAIARRIRSPRAPVEGGSDSHVLTSAQGAASCTSCSAHARGRGWDGDSGAIFDLRRPAASRRAGPRPTPPGCRSCPGSRAATRPTPAPSTTRCASPRRGRSGRYIAPGARTAAGESTDPSCRRWACACGSSGRSLQGFTASRT